MREISGGKAEIDRMEPADALGGGACLPGLSPVRVRFILLTYLGSAGVKAGRGHRVGSLVGVIRLSYVE